MPNSFWNCIITQNKTQLFFETFLRFAVSLRADVSRDFIRGRAEEVKRNWILRSFVITCLIIPYQGAEMLLNIVD